MARTPEGVVKDDIKKFLTSKGVWFAGAKQAPEVITGWMYMPIKMGPMGVNGIPDFVGFYKLTPVAIEAKAPKGEQSTNQKDRQREIEMAGGHYILAASAEDVRAYFKANGL